MSDSFPRQSAATRRFQLGSPRSFRISPDAQRVLFLRSDHGRDAVNSLWSYDIAARTETKIADPRLLLADDAGIPDAERVRRERMRETSSGITSYSVAETGNRVVFALAGQLFAGDVSEVNFKLLEVAGPVIDPRISPDGSLIAWASGKDLMICDFAGSNQINLTNETSDHTSWGLADFIAAEEFGRMHGYWWSPDSTSLIVERSDESAIQTWWISDPALPHKQPQEQRYPAAGTKNGSVSLQQITVDGQRTDLTWDNNEFEYLVSVSWQDDCDALITVANRAQQHFVTYAASAGSLRSVHEVADHEFVEVIPGQPKWHNGEILAIVDNRVSDTRELQLAGRAISPNGLQVMSLIDVTDDYVDVSATSNAIDRDLIRVAFDGTLTAFAQGGIAAATSSVDGLQVIVESRLDTHSRSYQLVRSGKTEHYFDSMAEAPNFKPEVHYLTTGDHQVNTAVLFPRDHKFGTRKLPVLLRPYGGPHGAQVLNGALTYAEDQWFADQGFAVIVADNRGTPGRGPAWDHAIYQDFVTPVIEDQVAAVEAVASKYPDDVDASRVGITGWSFGGYLSALAVMERPDIFHAAVAGAPVTEWKWYDTAYTERYLGHPDKHPEVYEKNSLMHRAATLARPLMLVHGLADDNVVAAHSLTLSSELLAHKKPHTVLPLSGVTHMTPQEIVSENLMLLTVEFFNANL